MRRPMSRRPPRALAARSGADDGRGRADASVRTAGRRERHPLRDGRRGRVARPVRGHRAHGARRRADPRAAAARRGRAASRWMLGARFDPVSRMTATRRRGAPRPRPPVRSRRAVRRADASRLRRSTRCSSGSRPSLRHEQRFTAELSHELRTPLARISGETELMLRRDRSPDEYREALASIQRSADHDGEDRRGSRCRRAAGGRADPPTLGTYATSSRRRSAPPARTASSSTRGYRSRRGAGPRRRRWGARRADVAATPRQRDCATAGRP